ncbi:DNA topoisomerase IB [Tessaracoccus antarcticus]|uniref:DNA topoisomerase n=1 Tax=Tessaracoccus antarcticus TaxID=2479848 RepID=A0A3M0GI55_9ACTN|nr:DNA topoisomerase IB [Tessaracoccus antarcticus]RMB61283.1 DNA topoisomerase IB [Tessaracoccus antarcticus]
MARLRRTSPQMKGWTRRRAGRGFSYRDAEGLALAKDEVARVKALAIPPAWNDVWICPAPNGHLQAVGTDAAGRRQYLYHPQWRTRRDRSKFQRVTEAAHNLPQARRRIEEDLAVDGMGLDRACATAVRLLDIGYFRIGNDAYTDANGSFGLTTLERQHVRRRGDSVVFSFIGKSGISHTITVDDGPAVEALEVMRSRRTHDSHRLLAHKEEGGWSDLSSSDVNAYLAGIFGGGFTAKDFRTWHATVIAAEVLALDDEPGDTKVSRKRAIKQAVMEVSSYLGNTPTIARSSYIDPRVIDSYENGHTIRETARGVYRSPQARQRTLEQAVLELLSG